MATFTTSKSNEYITFHVETTTGYYLFQRNGEYPLVINTNNNPNFYLNSAAGPEITISSCDSTGTITGDVTVLTANNKQITSFDGTGLSGLTRLDLGSNQLTSFNGTGLSSLSILNLSYNQLTSFDGANLSSLSDLSLNNNQLTSFSGTGLSGLNFLSLENNLLSSFNGTGLSSLSEIYLNNNQLTSLNISGLTNLHHLQAQNNLLTPSVNNSILSQLAANQLAHSNEWSKPGSFYTSGGRTSASITDYDYLISNDWDFKLGIELVIETTTTTTTEAPTTTTTTEAPTTTTTTTVAGAAVQYFLGPVDNSVVPGGFTGYFRMERGWYDFPYTFEVTNLVVDGQTINLNGKPTTLTINSLNDLVVSAPHNFSTEVDANDYHYQMNSNDPTTAYIQNVSDWLTNLFQQVNPNYTFVDDMKRVSVPIDSTFTMDINVSTPNFNQNYEYGTIDGQVYYSHAPESQYNFFYTSVGSGNTSTTTTTTSAPVTGNGKMRIKGLTSGGGTTTTTTTEAPTTTTTTTMAPPTSNATNFLIKSVSLTGSTLQALTEFRLANPLVDGYLVTMDDLSDPIYGNGANSLSNSVLSIVNGTSYSIGDTIGINTFNSQPNGTIVKVGPATNVSIIDGFDTERFTIPNIQGGQNGHTFEFNVYAYNLDSNGSPVYNVNNPLTTALVVQQTSSGGGKGGQKKG
jgi:hypothetical protein